MAESLIPRLWPDSQVPIRHTRAGGAGDQRPQMAQL